MSETVKALYVSCAVKGLYGLKHIRAQGLEIAAVVTIPPAVAERHEVSGYADFAPDCAALDLPLVTLESYVLEPARVAPIAYDVVIVNGKVVDRNSDDSSPEGAYSACACVCMCVHVHMCACVCVDRNSDDSSPEGAYSACARACVWMCLFVHARVCVDRRSDDSSPEGAYSVRAVCMCVYGHVCRST